MELTTVNITAKQMRQEALNSLIRLIESRIEKAARCDAQLFCEFACGKGADLSLIMNIFMEKGFLKSFSITSFYRLNFFLYTLKTAI